MDPSKLQPTQETKLHFLDYWRIIRIRKTVILAVFLLVVITATLVTFILPQSFQSGARIKVERDQTDVSSLSERMNAQGFDPYFIQTEFETIRSEKVLTKVMNALDLRSKWGARLNMGGPLSEEQTLSLLRSKIDLRPVRNTSFLEINVVSDKAEEAAELANEIAKAYTDFRTEQRQELSSRGIKALEERVEAQSGKVRKAQGELDVLREELGVPDAVATADAPTMLLSAENLRKIEGLRIENDATFSREETVYNKLKDLERDKLIQVLPTAVPDQFLSSLLEQKTLADQRLLAVEKDFGSQHPDYQKAKVLKEDLEQKIDARIEGIMVSLYQRVEALRTTLNRLNASVVEAKSNDIAQAKQTAPYFAKKAELEELRRFRSILDMKIAAEQIDEKLPKSTMVTIMDPARPNFRPVRPNKVLNITLGIIIGLVVGVGLAFFIEYLDTSVKTIDDVERALQAPVLGVIPQNVGLILEEGVDSPHAEAYRVLRTNILFSRKDDKLNSVAVVSAGAGEGKSTTVFNLACVFAQSGHRVLVVDSDLRRPTLHKMLKVSNSLGLTNYLLKQNTLEEVIQTSNVPTLDFLASGKLPSSSLGILSSAQMRDLINELKQRYDFVFFDSPPIMGVSDASILASEVDMTLQVIQYRRYPQPMNIRAKALIEKVGGNLVGIVLNNINMSQDESYYYYSGYYHEYYSRNDEQESGRSADGAAVQPTKKA